MRNKVSPGEYLAFLSVKYDIDPDKFFYALISAEENQKSICEDLSIECRGKSRDNVVLLITKGPKVVAQFLIPSEFLLEQDNPIKNLKTDKIRRYLVKKNREPVFLPIRELRTGMKKVNLKAKVINIAKPTLVITRFGNYASVANALIADETGTIKLCLWNEQVSSISVGITVQIGNAHVAAFRGENQLRIGKNGTLSVVEDINAINKSV